VRQRRLIGAMVAGLLASGLAARGAEAQERRLRAEAGVGLFSLKRGAATGAAIGAEGALAYGLTDQFDVVAEVSYAPYQLRLPAPAPCPAPPAPCVELKYPYTVSQLTGVVGLTYALDVARWAPYGGLLVGGSRLGGGDGALRSIGGSKGLENRFDLVLAFGLDHQISDRWLLGAAIRYHMAPPGGATETTQLSLRVEYAWRR
jgi:opacity protein-like surface antigen